MIHWRPLRPVCRSSAIRDMAVFTTAMSSISIAVAAQTTTSVQRWVRIEGAPEVGEVESMRQACRDSPPRTSGESLGGPRRCPVLVPAHILEHRVRLLVDQPCQQLLGVAEDDRPRDDL